MTVYILQTDHGEEHAKLRVHVHRISISEDKGFAAFLLAGENNCDLLSCDWQNWELNAVELIKTAPSTRLSQTWKSEAGGIFDWTNTKHYNTTWQKGILLIVPLYILPNPLKSIWSEQLKTTTYFPRQRPMSLTVSVLPGNQWQSC